MKNISTAGIYARGLNHLFPDQFNWREVGIDTSAVDPEILAAQMQQWKAF